MLQYSSYSDVPLPQDYFSYTHQCLLTSKDGNKTKSDVKRKISAGILPISRHLEAAGLPYLFSIISVITPSVLAVMMPQQVVICMF